MIHNLEAYKQIAGVRNRNKINPNVYNLITEENFIAQVLAQIEIQNQVCKLINLFQAEDMNIADGASAWIELTIPEGLPRNLRNKYIERKKMALTEVALAAYYIDPYKDNNKLTSEEKFEGKTFISSRLGGTSINELIAFEAESDNISSLKAKTKSAKDFWTLAEYLMPSLSKIAMKLLKIPASTAQIERMFSMWQHIHTKIRNRLTFERSKKLMHCYHYLNTIDSTLFDEIENFAE